MQTRREFLLMSAGVACVVSMSGFVLAAGNTPINATAITQVFGDGVQMVAVAVEFSDELTSADVSAKNFSVADRTVKNVFVSQSADLTESEKGKFVIVQLMPDEEGSGLQEKVNMPNATAAEPTPGAAKPHWVAGDTMSSIIRYKAAKATVTVEGKTLQTQGVKNLIVDDFQQGEFYDGQTGKRLPYNFFKPQNQHQPLPLVLFMHDAGATSDQTEVALFQGLGAVIWADPAEQAKRPCYVLAPQFNEIVADDDWHTSDMLETTIHLVQKLIKEENIDPKRIYVTGQSGGCMLATAMSVKYPDFFTASYLVAGKWDAESVSPLAKNKIWFMAAVDDSGAFPSFNGITERLEKAGAKISRAEWNGTWNADQYRFAYDALMAEKSPINYTVFAKDSVFRETDSRAGASGHRNTWRIAYSIEPIREWLFAQTK
ncbi:hypothetical protein BKK51_11100 [Rodentibacter trehalosifermentans]|uniref:Uncharacterized protein n=2 Tax=Rodentibacter trehalosifermentans TaxID=1908263 RepID=A0A1V3J3U0_9PAST|nr:hypothetical protein BKK51_11100 [Rodentibacter trehalosifermentans]OOF49775.1 hypothetical protein BKK52_02775 [Rodentibacter trehalosifermentans]OOF51658.1 hypothetical protein BKK53_07045 [Rodentibacter trehalosifermentans]